MNLRDEARGRPCTLRLPGCSPGPQNETVVLCHREGGGTAGKSDDANAVLGCFACHSQLDSALPDYDRIFERALRRTHAIWKLRGINATQ